MNSRRITENFFIGVWLLVLCWLVFKMVATGNLLVGGVLIVAVPLVIFLVDYPALLACSALLFSISGLKVPGIGLNLYIFELFLMLGLASNFMDRIIHGRSLPSRNTMHIKYAIGLFFVIFLTMSVRGTGLRILGSSMWGGAHYIHIILLISAGLFLREINIKSNTLFKCMVWMSIFAFLKLILSNFIGGGSGEDALAGEVAVQRVSGAHVTAGYVVILGLYCFQRYQGLKASVGFLFLLGLGVILVLISGFRVGLIYLFLLLVSSAICFSAVKRRKFVGILVVVGIVGLVFLLLFVDKLPVAYQRALSIIPFLNISDVASMDATGTSEWRIELWKMLLPEITPHLLVGKGLAFDLDYAIQIHRLTNDNNLTFFTVVHNYHNGPLSLLIDLGLLGFLTGFGFMFAAIRYFSKFLKKKWVDIRLRYFFIGFYAYFISLTVVYVFIYGDLAAAFIKYLTIWFLLELLVHNGVEKEDISGLN